VFLLVFSSLGAFFELGKCAAFVLEINDEISGVVVGYSDAKEYYEYYRSSWIPKVRSIINQFLLTYRQHVLLSHFNIFGFT